MYINPPFVFIISLGKISVDNREENTRSKEYKFSVFVNASCMTCIPPNKQKYITCTCFKLPYFLYNSKIKIVINKS